MKKITLNPVLLALTLLAFIGLEIVSARLAFHTFGEVSSALYYLLIALNLIPLFLLIFKRQNQAAFTTAWVLGLGLVVAIVPYQFYLGYHFLSLKEEAANLMAYVYEEKLETGSYPPNLSDYVFTFPQLAQKFNYKALPGEDRFHLSYHVGIPTTSHYYSPETQKWNYYPD